jgi:hypothetical protein
MIINRNLTFKYDGIQFGYNRDICTKDKLDFKYSRKGNINFHLAGQYVYIDLPLKEEYTDVSGKVQLEIPELWLLISLLKTESKIEYGQIVHLWYKYIINIITRVKENAIIPNGIKIVENILRNYFKWNSGILPFMPPHAPVFANSTKEEMISFYTSIYKYSYFYGLSSLFYSYLHIPPIQFLQPKQMTTLPLLFSSDNTSEYVMFKVWSEILETLNNEYVQVLIKCFLYFTNTKSIRKSLMVQLTFTKIIEYLLSKYCILNAEEAYNNIFIRKNDAQGLVWRDRVVPKIIEKFQRP